METSAPKRRKTSPVTALPIESTTTSTTPTGPPPPPQPLQADAPKDDPPRSARSSYASPTKASLARHNPDILLRRLSSPTKARPAGSGPGGTQTYPLSLPQHGAPPQDPDRRLRKDHERAAGSHSTSDARLSRSPTRQLRGGLTARPRRTPGRPTPRPLPPPGPDDDDEILNPFMGRVLRRSPAGGLPQPDPQEPELPPTPVHPDNAASTPPSGIHSTPSRRPRRSRALAEKVRSSPTKQPREKPAGGVFQHGDENMLPTTEKGPEKELEQPLATRKVNDGTVQPWLRPKPSEVRGVQLADADEEKKRERDALQAEIAQLERDLDILVQENDRVGQMQLSKKAVTMPRDASDILDVLGRHLAPKQKETSANASDVWLQAAMDPVAFLPFGKPSSSLPTLFPEDSPTVERETEPISHHPVPMTAQEALPFLQAFTPLKFTSRIRMLPPPPPEPGKKDEPNPNPALLQHHSITATSSSAPGLFLARIDLTVDASTHTITSLALPSIEPPCATTELSPLATKILAGPDASPSGLSRNASVLTWAMASWLRVAVRRAKVWRTLDRELGTPDALERTVAQVRAARAGRRLKKKGGGGGDDRAGDADSDGVAGWVDSSAGADELLPYMDRQCMEFRVPCDGVEGVNPEADVPMLRVQWCIEFDWTGEATSRVRAMTRLPGKWRRADERTTLRGVPALFDKLLQRGGEVVSAVETIVTLLAGEQR